MAAKRKRDIISASSLLVSSTTSDLDPDFQVAPSDLAFYARNSASPLNLSKMNGEKDHPVLSPTAFIAERYGKLSIKSSPGMIIREEEEKMPSPGNMKRPKSESDNWSDCGSPHSSSTSLKDPLSPATPLNVAHIISQLHMPVPARQKATPSPNVPNKPAPASSASLSTKAIIASTGRDEVSSSGINGYNSPDSGIGGDLRKKRPPYPRAAQQEELCLVCGDRASGYHYNALTCEGCKGFFRRSITKNAVYQCKYGGSCDIDMYMRRKCQECRLRKCLTIGMRPECVVPETQCKAKRESKQQQQQAQQKDKATPTPAATSGASSSNTTVAVQQSTPSKEPNSPKSFSPANSSASPASAAPLIELTTLSDDQLALIRRLVVFQEQYELPSEEDFRSITPLNLSGTMEDDCANRFQHVAEITILTVQLIVEFAKRLPGFETLTRDDQIALLKACACELMMLRCSRRYDTGTDSIVFANNVPFTRENYKGAGLHNGDGLYNFCRSMCAMKVDNAEYAILAAIVIFSERPMLKETKKVEQIQEQYLFALRGYLDTNRTSKSGTIFARLLMRLTELRTLGHEWTELLFNLRLQKRRLPPLLSEIWDFDQQ